MSKKIHTVISLVLLGTAVLFFQGCDQVEKFIGYVSPRQQEAARPAPTERAEAPAPVAPRQEEQALPVRAAATQELPRNVLAKVGDWSITINDFNQQLAALQDAGVEGLDIASIDQRRYILGELLQQQILVQAALKRGLGQDADIEVAVKAFRDTVLAQAFVEQVTEGVTVSDAEARDFYNANQQDLVTQAEWRVAEIVVNTEEAARAILVELNQGIPFEQLARERSSGRNAPQGGDLGFMDAFEFERMGQVVSALDKGAVSGMFQGPQGFYIVKLIDKRGGAPMPFNEIEEDLKQYILMMKQEQALRDALDSLEGQIEININEQLLEE